MTTARTKTGREFGGNQKRWKRRGRGGEVFNACEDANAGKEERMERRREEWETTVKRNQDEDEGWG